MRQKFGLSGTALKWLALITMTIDHIGAFLLTWKSAWYIPLRLIGRFAFPVYCMLLVEGDHYSRDRRRYALRLLIFALLSEIPYNLAHGSLWYPKGQNVFFTLFLGELLLILIREIRERSEDTVIQSLGILLLAIGFMVIAEIAGVDYGMGGILAVFMLGVLRPWNMKSIAAIALCMALCWHSYWVQTLAALAFPIAFLLYNGRRGSAGPLSKYAFYAYYPLHLLIIGMIAAAR